jgi:hypothetical protein
MGPGGIPILPDTWEPEFRPGWIPYGTTAERAEAAGLRGVWLRGSFATVASTAPVTTWIENYDASTGIYTDPNAKPQILVYGDESGTHRIYHEHGESFQVETYTKGRTGVTSYSEGVREIPKGTNLGVYFAKQESAAWNEAAHWWGWFFTETAKTIAAPYLVGGLFRVLGWARVGIPGIRFRWSWRFIGKVLGFRNWDVYGFRMRFQGWPRASTDWHIYSINWYRPAMWGAKNQVITTALLAQAQAVNYSLARLIAFATSPFGARNEEVQ